MSMTIDEIVNEVLLQLPNNVPYHIKRAIIAHVTDVLLESDGNTEIVQIGVLNE